MEAGGKEERIFQIDTCIYRYFFFKATETYYSDMNTLLEFGTRVLCKQKIYLNPDELNANMEATIEDRVKQFEGSCNSQGYVLKKSIVLIDRKTGLIPRSGNPGGMGKFNITFQAVILSPKPNQLIPCKIQEKNTIGVLAQWGYGDTFPIVVTCLKQNQTQSVKCEELEIGDFIIIRVLSARCNFKDTRIVISGEVERKITAKEYQDHILDFRSALLLTQD